MMKKTMIQLAAMLRVLLDDLRVAENTAADNVLLTGALCGCIMWTSLLMGLIVSLFWVG